MHTILGIAQTITAFTELFDPVYDGTTNTLTYTARAENTTYVDLPGEFGQSILVVDTKLAGVDIPV